VVAFQTGQLLLGLIAVFVWHGASRENRYAQIRDVFRDLTAGDALQPTPGWLEPNDTLSRAVRLHQTHPQAAYPVLLRDEPIGFVLPDDLARVFPVAGPAAPVTAAMRSGGIVVVPVDEPLENVVARLQPEGVLLALVERDGALAGLVSPASIGDCIERVTAERRGIPIATPPPLPDGPRLT
jgi:predicted transcriptional regulator